MKTVDDLEEEPLSEPISIGGKLMYTEEQWLARQKEKKKGGDDSGLSSSSKEDRRRPRGGKSRSQMATVATVEEAGKERRLESPAANRDDTCLNCHRADHWTKDCP